MPGLAEPHSHSREGLEQRVDALEREMGQLRQHMSSWQSHLERVPAPGRGIGEGEGEAASALKAWSDASSSSMSDEEVLPGWSRRTVEELLDGMVYSVRRSAWDVCLFIGHPLFGVSGAALLAVGLFCNIAMQGFIVQILFTDPTFGWQDSEDQVAGAQKWRYHYGHSIANANPLTGTSLVSRVCGKDGALNVANSQMNQVVKLEHYLQNNDGWNLCTVVVCLFAMHVCAELRDIWHFLCGIFGVKRGDRTLIMLVNNKPVLKCISVWRLAMGCGVAAVRTLIAFGLLYRGTIWLVSTIDIESLLLNAVALAFVLDTDEMLYTVFSPHRLDNLLDAMEPLPCSKAGALQYFLRVAKYAMVVTFVFWMLVHELDHVVGTQRQIEKTLCGGARTFVFGINPAGAFSYSNTPEFRKHTREQIDLSNNITLAREEVIRRIIADSRASFHGEGDSIWPTAMHAFESDLNLEVGRTIADMARLQGCQDSPINFTRTMYLSTGDASFFATSNLSSVPGCEDAREFCKFGPSYGVRLYCPVTCGCDSPISGLVRRRVSDGCPQSCQRSENYLSILSWLPCEDWSFERLRAEQGWIDFLLGLKHMTADFYRNASMANVFWSDEDVSMMNCSGLWSFVIGLRPNWNTDSEMGLREGVLLEYVCASGMVAFCPETCWCANSSMQAAWKVYHPVVAQNLFDNQCPTSCKTAGSGGSR